VKFDKICIPKIITQEKGIKPIEIKRLPNVIAFIGKNGSGKTRILDLIEENPFSFGTIFGHIPGEISSILYKIQQLKELEYLESMSADKPYDQNIKLKCQSIKLQLKEENYKSLPTLSDNITKKYIRRIKQEEISSLQKALTDSTEQKSFEEIIENIKNTVDYNELTSINKGAINYLMNLPHKLVADDNKCKGDTNKFHSSSSYKRFDSLRKYIKIFLNKELEWEEKATVGKYLELPEGGYNVTYQGFFKLNKREFNYDEFSNGEKILFSYAIFFFMLEQNQKLNIKESIIIIDEPELHLHADSEIEVIEKLREIISDKGQLIIATHSINILSTLNYEEIFLVKDGEIHHPSQESLASSLSELIGIEEKIIRLSDLLFSRDNWSFINFISQCFLKPEAIKLTDENNSNLDSVKKMIKSTNNSLSKVFLDFGAGRGRILQGLLMDNNLFPKLNYYALEPNIEYHPELNKLGIKNIYASYEEITDNSLDFILLSNVLHEIPITSWERTLNKIIDSLNDNGYLMIVEPKVLSKGEKIDDSGFIVLTEKEIQVLFELPYEFQSFYIEEYKEKITSVIIQKTQLKKINKKSITKALYMVQQNSLDRTKELLLKKDENISDYARGRKMAFFAMQYMNAQLCIDKIKE
jgi:predicted ATPase